MKNEKKYPKKQIEKYSVLFLQLSLVLVLFVVYQLMESETKRNNYAGQVLAVPEIDFITIQDATPMVFTKDKKVLAPPVKPIPFMIDEINVVENSDPTIETIVHTPIHDEEIDVAKVLERYQPESNDSIVPDVPFVLIEDAPVYKGCEGLSKSENKKCFMKSIKRFVLRKFDMDVAQGVGLRSGTYRIFAQFIVSKEGTVTEIVIKAPHHRLEKEVKIILEKLPRFIPGMQRKVPVNVKFTLPIAFKIP